MATIDNAEVKPLRKIVVFGISKPGNDESATDQTEMQALDEIGKDANGNHHGSSGEHGRVKRMKRRQTETGSDFIHGSPVCNPLLYLFVE